MNPIRSVRSVIPALIVAAVGVFWMAAPANARAAEFGAIAYSTKTGAYGYADGYGSRADAEKAALSKCNASDARVVVWCKDEYAAMAVGDNGAYGYGCAGSKEEAERLAQDYCRNHGGRHAHVVCWVYSGT